MSCFRTFCSFSFLTNNGYVNELAFSLFNELPPANHSKKKMRALETYYSCLTSYHRQRHYEV